MRAALVCLHWRGFWWIAVIASAVRTAGTPAVELKTAGYGSFPGTDRRDDQGRHPIVWIAPTVVVISSAIPQNNPELIAARERQLRSGIARIYWQH